MLDFHKTMRDVQKLFHKNKPAEAVQILKQHEENVRRIYAGLSEMKPCLDSVAIDMQKMETAIGGLTAENKEVKIEGRSFDDWMKDFEANYHKLHEYIRQLKLHVKLTE
jgi:hypothetical protein